MLGVGRMRKREVIQKDGTVKNDLIIEVLLDIRALLVKQAKEKKRLDKVG